MTLVAFLLVLMAGPTAADASGTSSTTTDGAGSSTTALKAAALDSTTVATWTTASPSVSPPPLTGAAVAYDPGTNPPTIVLFGGKKADGSYSADTWTWNGSTWTDYTASSTSTYSPPARADASLAYDAALNQLVLYGGRGANGAYSDTWTWNGQSWIPVDASSCPPARYSAGLAYGPSGDLLLYGGTGSATSPAGAQSSCSQPVSTSSGTQTLADAWLWNGSAWSQVASGPPALSGESLSYDSASGDTVLFGGTTQSGALSDQTWTWNGSKWQRQSPKSSPPARTQALLADVPGIGTFLVGGSGAGGAALSDGWLWSSGQWTAVAATGKEDTSAAPVGAFDASESRVVVFSAGSSSQGDTTQLVELARVAVSTPTAPSTTVTTTRPSSKTTTTTTPTDSKTPQTETKTTTKPSSSTSAPSAILTVKRGSAVHLTWSGFAPGATVTITFHSKPYFIGRVTASAKGDVDTDVEVPASAAPGEHHFEATGMSSNGKVTTLLTSVLVLAPTGKHGTSAVAKGALFGIAILIPVAAWGVMAESGRRRRRRRAGA